MITKKGSRNILSTDRTRNQDDRTARRSSSPKPSNSTSDASPSIISMPVSCTLSFVLSFPIEAAASSKQFRKFSFANLITSYEAPPPIFPVRSALATKRASRKLSADGCDAAMRRDQLHVRRKESTFRAGVSGTLSVAAPYYSDQYYLAPLTIARA